MCPRSDQTSLLANASGTKQPRGWHAPFWGKHRPPSLYIYLPVSVVKGSCLQVPGEENVEGTWISELGIWVSVHTFPSSLGRRSGWRERGGWSQHLDPALPSAPALFSRSCPDFPSLLRRLHLNLAFCKNLKGVFVKMGGYFYFTVGWLDLSFSDNYSYGVWVCVCAPVFWLCCWLTIWLWPVSLLNSISTFVTKTSWHLLGIFQCAGHCAECFITCT